MKPLLRFALDAFYVLCFFAITLAGAIGAHLLAGFLDKFGVDAEIVWMVRQLERGLVLIDCVGVIIGSVVSLYRFIQALREDASAGKGGRP